MNREAAWKALAKSNVIGLLVADTDGRVRDCNEELGRILGRSREELIARGVRWADLTPQEQWALDLEALAQAQQTGCSKPYEKYLVRADGKRIPVLVALTSPRSVERQYIALVSDITAVKKSELVLRESEERLRLALKAARLGVWEMNIMTGEAHEDARACEIFGRPPGQGHTSREEWLSHIHPEDREFVRQATLRTELDETTPMELDFRYVRPDGQVVWVRSTGRMYRDETGRPYRAQGLIADITESMQYQHELQRRAERLALLSEAVGRLLKTGGEESTIAELFQHVARHLDLQAYCSTAAEENGQGVRVESAAGFPDTVRPHLCRPDLGQSICGIVARDRLPLHISSANPASEELMQAMRSLGLRAYASFPLMAGERLLGTIAFGTNTRDEFTSEELDFLSTISQYVAVAKERLRLEQELRLRVDELAEADRRKDEFLAMLAHELRNPLAPVRNCIHLLRMYQESDPRVVEQYDVIDRQVSHMARLLDDLLDVSRITRGTIELHLETLRLAEAVERSIEIARPLLTQHRHTFRVVLPPQEIGVEADLDRLAQAIGNLLTNAAKYTPDGGEIWLIVSHHNGHATLRVRDNGIGIAPEMLQRIFDVFAQADHSLNRSHGGLGLGLTLVRSIVELHGGTIEARSQGLGTGSEFVMRLPAVDIGSAMQPEQRNAQESPRLQTIRRRVLVVDDVAETATSLEQLLALWGHEVRTAHSGQEALDIAPSFRPDVVLLDIGLPDMNGYEVARRLRQMPQFGHTFLVAQTGYGQESDRREAYESGFNYHMVKPLDLATLRAVLLELPMMAA